MMKLSLFFLFMNCHKQFDEPPDYTGVIIASNLSIRELLKLHTTGGYEKINSDAVIEGIVIADDRTDNLYKSIIIEDSTGAITVKLDGFSLYNTYPVGRKVYIKLSGLWLGDYARMIQLGAGIDRTDSASPQLLSIPQPLFNRYIIKGTLNNLVAPKTVSIDQLADSLQGQLVSINNVEFLPSDTGKPYADGVNQVSLNRTIKACGGGSAYIRTSGFAKFANQLTPRGNGNVTAVYTVFRTEKQLLLRDTSDIQLNGLRCTVPGIKTLFSENFESTPSDTIALPNGWKNIPESGGRQFLCKRSGNTNYIELNAFASNQPVVTTWFIMPPVNLNNSANEILSFVTKDGFDNGATLQVYLSTNYDGGNTPWKAKWTVLPAVISKGSVSGMATDWISSGNVSLNSFSGNVSIAFRYDGADPSNNTYKRTTTFRLDNVKIVGN